MRVLHVITGLDVGGAESMLTSLVGAKLADLEQSVVSLIPGGYYAAEIRSRGVRVTELALRVPSQTGTELLKLARLIRHERPDVVQGWMYHGNLAASVALVLSGRSAVTRIAWGIRRGDPSADQWASRPVVRWGALLARFTDAVVANSEAGLAYHAELGYRTRRMLVIHNGIDTNRFRPDAQARAAVRSTLGLTSTEFVVAHVGRVHPVKNHDGFIEAIRGLPGLCALAIGAGTETLPDLTNLKRLGRRADVPTLLAACDVIVSSSHTEGFSNALAEGMAVGLLPVATDVGDSRIIVGNTGVVVKPRSFRALREAITHLAAMPRAEMDAQGERARQRIVANFSLDRALREFAQLYTELAASAAT